jgi:hypothetical protein
MIPNLLAISDVLGTGWFAADAAKRKAMHDGCYRRRRSRRSAGRALRQTDGRFYAGWPNAFSALPVVKEVFEKRQK